LQINPKVAYHGLTAIGARLYLFGGSSGTGSLPPIELREAFGLLTHFLLT
jgi:hypothetical protein